MHIICKKNEKYYAQKKILKESRKRDKKVFWNKLKGDKKTFKVKLSNSLYEFCKKYLFKIKNELKSIPIIIN